MSYQDEIAATLRRQTSSTVVDMTVVCVMWVLAIAATFALSALAGYILQIIWGWFMVPLGLVPLTFTTAIGVYMVVNFFKLGLQMHKVTDPDKKPASASVTVLAQAFGMAAAYLMGWGIAAIWHFWIL